MGMTAISPITAEELASIGLSSLAYVKAIKLPHYTGYAVHAADGRVIAYMNDLPTAIAAIWQQSLIPVSLH